MKTLVASPTPRTKAPAAVPTEALPPTPLAVANDEPPVPLNKPRNWKKPLLYTALGLVLAGAAVKFGEEWYTVGRFIEKTDDAYVGGNITVIAPKVASFIDSIEVQDNQFVHAGDLLIRLDDRDYRAALARAEAGVKEQEAALIELSASRRLQEATIAEARAAVTASDAETERSRSQQERSRKLVESAAESRQNFEKADADFKSAVAKGQKDRAALEAAQRQLDVLDSREGQIRASLQAAEANRDLAKLNLSYTELRAPVDGVVGNRSAQSGAYAPAGTQLISLIPAKGLWVDANFKESQIGQMKTGMPVTVESDSTPGKVFHGHVESLAPATGAKFSVLPPENATGNFTKIVQRVPVRVALDDDAFGELRPGLSITARVNVHATPSQP